ncbi:hypothetical protein KY284_034706 [Solanum tuberosum]|nr:hypothetical protein KY284_034706 [Solanum tuberosum]
MTKLEPQANKCIFLRYATGVKGYRLWCIDRKTPSSRKKAIVETGCGVCDHVKLKVEFPLTQLRSSGAEEMEKVQNLNQDDNVDAPIQ